MPPAQSSPDPLHARLEALEQELACVRSEFFRLSGRVSHDLQGVLSAVERFAAVLEASAAARLTEKELHYVRRIQAGGVRGAGLLRDLCALSGLSVAPFEPCRVDGQRLVQQCMHEVLPAVEGRAVEWSVEPPRWPTLVADPALLQAALGQLLANAAKFTRGRAPAQIRIQLEETPSEWRIAVGDNGAGFDPAYADRLFTPFERLHTASEFEGNGIGLAIVKLVAQRHGGRVEAEGHPGEGARVAFTLRRPSGPVRESAPHDGEASALPPAGGARALRVLLADDEALVLGTLQGMLERLGCEVTVASGGPAALQLLERHAACGPAFDLVISDWLMPHVTGPQLARAARQMFPDARVVLLTGQRPQVDGSYPTPASVDEVLGKPVRSGSLREVLSRVQRD